MPLPPITVGPRARIVFQGDSITEAGRRPGDGTSLGSGYVRLVADELGAAHPGLRFVNRGVGGDRAADLRSRWQRDTTAHEPALVSVMVGVNDTWRRYDSGDPTSLAAYERDYRAVLEESRAAGARLLLIEPFLVPVDEGQWTWREDLDGRIHVVRRLAAEFGAGLLCADGLLNQAAARHGGADRIAGDGVHLTPLGHSLLAEAWLGLVSVG